MWTFSLQSLFCLIITWLTWQLWGQTHIMGAMMWQLSTNEPFDHYVLKFRNDTNTTTDKHKKLHWQYIGLHYTVKYANIFCSRQSSTVYFLQFLEYWKIIIPTHRSRESWVNNYLANCLKMVWIFIVLIGSLTWPVIKKILLHQCCSLLHEKVAPPSGQIFHLFKGNLWALHVCSPEDGPSPLCHLSTHRTHFSFNLATRGFWEDHNTSVHTV